MKQLLVIELIKIFSKRRSYIGFLAIGVLTPIIQVAMYSEGESYFDLFTQSLQQAFEFSGNLTNGYLIAFIVLNSLLVHVPLLTSLVVGDLLAGEATAGTYRLIIPRPASRTQLTTAKFIAGVVYANALVVWMALLSFGISIWLFGTGELLVIGSKITIIARHDILWRFVGAYFYAGLSMSTVAAIAFFFSALVENAIGPIAATMTLIIVFTIVSSLETSMIDAIRPFLFTNHLVGWRLMFDNPIDVSRLATSAIVLVGHIVALFAGAILVMRRKDILS